jgi:hypothetical protein
MNQWLEANQPEIREKLSPYWEPIYQELVAYYTDKGLF